MYHYRYNQKGITQHPDYNKYKLIIDCLNYVDEYIKHCDNYIVLQQKLLLRTLYIVVMVAMTGYFSPANKDSYKIKVSKFKHFLKEPLIKRAFQADKIKEIDIQRKFILYLIKYNLYPALYLLGIIRNIQLKQR